MKAIVHTAAHDAFPKGKIVTGKFIEPYINGLFWFDIKLPEGITRTILAKKYDKRFDVLKTLLMKSAKLTPTPKFKVKLNKEKANDIRKRFTEKLNTRKELTALFGVSERQISRVINNEVWLTNDKNFPSKEV